MTLEYLRALQHLLTEVRILRTERYLQATGQRLYTGDTISGYYTVDAYEKLIEDIRNYDADSGTKAIYTTLHACDPALHARAANRLRLNAQDTTSDHEIITFTNFPIDIDPNRPSGISASEAEMTLAKEKATQIAQLFESLGIPLWKGMSGNGYHLLSPLNPFENTAENAERFKTLGDLIANHFDTDETIYNSSRIWKLYGTTARKGDSTPERPHRRAKIWLPLDEIHRIDFAEFEEKIQSELQVTTVTSLPEQKNKFPAKQHNEPKKTETPKLREWLDAHNITYYTEKPYKGTSKFIVDCPHDASHKRDAWITDEGGQWQFSCSHNSCKGDRSTWKAFKAAHGIKNHPNPKKKLPGRPSKVEQAQSATIPETLLEKPIVMLQELVELDGQTIIAERSRDVVSDDVAKHLWRNGNPTQLYRRGQDLGTLRPAENGLLFFPSDKDSIAGDMVRCVSLVKFGPQGTVTPIANPPVWLAADILRNQAINDVPQIKVILSHPFFNGKELVSRRGYDTESQSFLDVPKSEVFDLDIEANTPEADLDIWRDLLKDFPFKEDSDFENAIGYMLTLITRQGLKVGEVTPLFDVTAPREGVGKSLLADVLTAAVTGQQPITRSLGAKKEEIEKGIGAALRGAPEVIIFDNVDPGEKLDSGTLASIVTNPRRAFRILGVSEECFYENKTVILYTGSNVELTPELAKRMVAIRLTDPGIAEKDRKVEIEGILNHVLENRHDYLGSLLRMVKRWQVAGAVEVGETTHRMRQWSRVIRGIMKENGFGEAFLENTDAIMLQANPEFTLWSNAFKAIVDQLEDQAFEGWTLQDVFQILSYEKEVYAHHEDRNERAFTRQAQGAGILNELIGGGLSDQSRRVRLAKLLRSKVGAVFAGYELVDLHRHVQKRKLYALKNISNPQPPTHVNRAAPHPFVNGKQTESSPGEADADKIIAFVDGRDCQQGDDILKGVMKMTGFDQESSAKILGDLIKEKRIVKRTHKGEMYYFSPHPNGAEV